MYYLSCFLWQSIPGGLLRSVPPLPYEGSKPVQKKSLLNIHTLPGDDPEKPQLDIDSSGM